MNREEIIRLARESELLTTTTEKGYQVWMPENLERFAHLVAAAEREACAAICDRIASPLPGESLEGWREGYVDGAGACRNLIRKRGQE